MLKPKSYDEFVEKFKSKKTTDDCHTPDATYDAVMAWVADKYSMGGARIVRPFWSGADYTMGDYSGNCVVVDNPPFSILAEILRYYQKNGIKFFLFAPTLTLFSSLSVTGVTAIVCGATVTYENGAKVNTSFLTNMTPETLVELDPDLTAAVIEANKKDSAKLPKFNYPPQVVTAAKLAKHKSVKFSIPSAEGKFIRNIESLSSIGKSIFGGGVIMSNEKASEFGSIRDEELDKALTLKLSAKEMIMVNELSCNNKKECNNEHQ